MKKDLSGATFIIPLKIDTPDRKRNTALLIDYLQKYVAATLLVVEYDREPRFKSLASTLPCHYRFIRTDDANFWKTRIINRAVGSLDTPYFVVQDSDVIIDSGCLERAYRLLTEGGYDIVYPYRNDAMWVPSAAVEELAAIDHDVISGWSFETASSRNQKFHFVGLCSFIKVASFCRIGKLNEHIRSWGYEDVEFFERAQKFGLNITRLDNLAYHLGHQRTEDSGPHNKYFTENEYQFQLTRRADTQELARMVRKWTW